MSPKTPLCACNCGERIPYRVVVIAESRGEQALYVDAKHRKREEQRRARARARKAKGGNGTSKGVQKKAKR